jgi:hypothetical protein
MIRLKELEFTNFNVMFKVRFNLGLGKNYMKWKLTHPRNKVEYLVPDEVQLVLTNCKLKNNKKTATKIFDGSHKVVCAWIECESVEVINKTITTFDKSKQISYNPRKTPNWVYNDENVDNQKFTKIISVGRNLIKE